MMNIKQTALLLALGALPLTVPAEDFDGSRELLCAVTELMECTEFDKCEAISPEAASAPEFLKVNVKKKELTGVGDQTRVSKIRNTEKVDGTLILQGAENGRGWTMSIAMESGEYTGTSTGQQIAFILFGNCHPL